MSVTSTCRDISDLTPLAQEACNLFLEKCKKAGIEIFITETYRSEERQNALYAQGRTKPGNIVTWTKNSPHTSRYAWDIACSPPNALYDAKILKKAGEIAEKLGITWGGIWATPDMPHFEIDENWKMPKGDEEMAEKIYAKLSNMPEWARATIEKLMKKGFLAGDENGNLNLSETAVKVFVVNDRAGLYD